LVKVTDYTDYQIANNRHARAITKELLIKDDNVESNCSMIENNPSKGVSLSDLICIFAMSIVGFICTWSN
ncbi:hypothetical protein, partial [Hoylesella timonensis]|uniref:hypothetical protein n=1 Tax=Hoylesella timonensis TaxID=386414 RepID=UPI001E37BE45